jgi:hypothetical protein
MMEERHARGYSSLPKSIGTLATARAASETLTGRAACPTDRASKTASIVAPINGALKSPRRPE